MLLTTKLKSRASWNTAKTHSQYLATLIGSYCQLYTSHSSSRGVSLSSMQLFWLDSSARSDAFWLTNLQAADHRAKQPCMQHVILNITRHCL